MPSAFTTVLCKLTNIQLDRLQRCRLESRRKPAMLAGHQVRAVNLNLTMPFEVFLEQLSVRRWKARHRPSAETISPRAAQGRSG